MKAKYILLLVGIFIFGCSSAGSHLRSVQSGVGDRITVGRVQREISIGMTAGEVVEVLGSPNIVSTDENRREVWIYDKIATDVSYSASEGGLTLLLLGGGDSVGGTSLLGAGGASGAASKSQRTLTVIIKFDENNMVRDFAYHTSRF